MPVKDTKKSLEMIITNGIANSTPPTEVNETDNVTSVELQRNRRLLHFSDGTMEELTSDSDADNDDEIDAPDKCMELQIDEKQLPFMPRLKYRASKVGTNILAGIDYIGGGLAALLGITKPKYASETQFKNYLEVAAKTEENANVIWQEVPVNKDEVITFEPTSLNKQQLQQP